jgi:hypothetical protein
MVGVHPPNSLSKRNNAMNKNGLSFTDRALLYGWIQSQRCDNYAAHFAARALVHSMQPEDVEPLARYADLRLPFPILNILGAAYDNWIPPEQAKVLSKMTIIPILNPWYLSDAGWEGFQILWTALPEPDAMTDCNLWISLEKLWITHPQPVDKSHASCGKPSDNLVTYPQANRPLSSIGPKIAKVINSLWTNERVIHRLGVDSL